MWGHSLGEIPQDTRRFTSRCRVLEIQLRDIAPVYTADVLDLNLDSPSVALQPASVSAGPRERLVTHSSVMKPPTVTLAFSSCHLFDAPSPQICKL